MNEILFQYHRVHPTSWVYLSSLLTIGLFFKFSRVWSVRNLDLAFLILLAPGLIAVEYGREAPSPTVEQVGYIWLFATTGIFLLRMLLDPLMVRRPLLEPNLSAGGMTFIGTALLIFLMANVVNGRAQPAEDRASWPGYPALNAVPSITTQVFFAEKADASAARPGAADAADGRRDVVAEAFARTLTILAHVAVVLGMVVVGYRHFDNIRAGIAAATLYLLLPYTALITGRLDHVAPAALLVWAVVFYRRPLVAGGLVGLAIGACYYPVYLLPLWLSFYWRRGLVRFSTGVALVVAALVGSLALLGGGWEQFAAQARTMLGFGSFAADGAVGFWADAARQPYRLPVLAAFLALCGGLALWPAQKNLGTLLSCSAAVMLATQFWHTHGGGLYMGWYLPLVLLTVFRPNLEDRVALAVLGAGWLSRPRTPAADRAA